MTSTPIAFEVSARTGTAVLPDPQAPLGRSWSGSIVERFLRHPAEKVAIEFEDEQWTYGDLGRISAGLAGYLSQFERRGNGVVAIYATRSASLIAALLGIIRAGFGFVILDPVYPVARALRCLELAQPVGLINLLPEGSLPGEMASALRERGNQFLLHLTGRKAALLEEKSPAAGGKARLPEVSDPEDLLYIAFTSGSTGVPKAIFGHHRPVGHFLAWQQQHFQLGAEHRVSMLSGLAHDPLLRDVFLPLWIGGTICVPPQSCYEVPNRLFEWMRDSRITLAHLTPSLGNLLLASSRKQTSGTLDTLEHAFFGGEMLKYSLVRRLRPFAPRVQVVNCYGATETPQVMGFHVVTDAELEAVAQEDGRVATVPVGRGIGDTQLLVLDSAGGLCEAGKEGQICIRSPYLAKKVLGPDGQPVEVFRPNTFSRDAADLVYHTGDYGFYRPDGAVVCTGRKDRQIKVRGHRLQLEEIEAVLASEPRVREYHLDVEIRESEDPLLTLYVSFEAGGSFDAEQVKQLLKNNLPEFMVPGRVIEVDQMPITPNGKIDVALLKQTKGGGGGRVARLSQQGEASAEMKVLSLVSEQMGGIELAPDEDLVSAGLNSLQAINICCAIEAKFGVTLAVQDLLACGTAGRLALRVAGRSAQDRAAAEVAGLTAPPAAGTGAGKTRAGRRGELFPSNERLLVGIKNRILQILARVAPDVWRIKFHKLRGVRIGEDVSIGYDSIIETSYPWLVRIGNHVNIGMRVTIIGHFRGMTTNEAGDCSVDIQDDVFIGPQVVILPKVTIGKGAVVSAGSVVNSSIPPLVLAHGNPAVPVAKCGVPLAGETQYEEFLRQLRPL